MRRSACILTGQRLGLPNRASARDQRANQPAGQPGLLSSGRQDCGSSRGLCFLTLRQIQKRKTSKGSNGLGLAHRSLRNGVSYGGLLAHSGWCRVGDRRESGGQYIQRSLHCGTKCVVHFGDPLADHLALALAPYHHQVAIHLSAIPASTSSPDPVSRQNATSPMSDDMNHSEAAHDGQLTPESVSAASEAGKSPEREEKTRAILEACSHRDIASLQTLAQSSGGLLSDALRQKACM